MNSTLKEIYGTGIIPVLKYQSMQSAERIADILCGQSLPVIELVVRSTSTFEIVRFLKQKHPKMIVGLSNVMTEEQIEQAIEAKADYVSTVHVNEKLIQCCKQKEILIIPECTTSMDIELANSLEIPCVKLLAGTALAELKMIDELKERYFKMNFIMTPGIESSEFVDYLNKPSVVACAIEGMQREKDLETLDYELLEHKLKEMVKNLLGVELAHVGINGTPETYQSIAEEYSVLLDCGLRELPGLSFFAGTTIEVMKQNGRGKNGHIAYRVNNVERAMHYYQNRGYRFVEETFKYNEAGKIIFAYFENEIGGFAIHLTQK